LRNDQDREVIRRDVLVIGAVVLAGLVCAGLIPVFGLSGALIWLLLVVLGALFAMALLRYPSLMGLTTRERAHPPLHPGISAHRIPVAGAPGFAFAVLMVEMFWFGVPHYRRLVVLSAVFGVLLGGALVLARRPGGR
jgi:hypothetical protein